MIALLAITIFVSFLLGVGAGAALLNHLCKVEEKRHKEPALDILREIVECHTCMSLPKTRGSDYAMWVENCRLRKALDDARTLINSGARADLENGGVNDQH